MGDSEFTTNPNRIERWAREYDVVPVRRDSTVELISRAEIDDSDERLDWETFHREMGDDEKVVVRYLDADEPAAFDVADYDSALGRVRTPADYEREELEARLLEGETIEETIPGSAIAETTDIEAVTLESEVVDHQILDRAVVDVELRGRRCHTCDVVSAVEDVNGVADAEVTHRSDYGADDRFLVDDEEATNGAVEAADSYPFDLTVEVEEVWMATIEEREQYTVETHIEDSEKSEIRTDEAETDTVDAREFDTVVDVAAVHEHILRHARFGDSGDERTTPGTETHHVKSEFRDDDVITTYLLTDRTTEREISERRRLTAEVVSGELVSRTTEHETIRETRLTEREPTGGTETSEVTDDTREGLRVVPDKSDEGKPVIVPPEEKVGLVSVVQNRTAYVDPDPGLTDRIAAKLGWSEIGDEEFPIDENQIERITDEEIFIFSDFEERRSNETEA